MKERPLGCIGQVITVLTLKAASKVMAEGAELSASSLGDAIRLIELSKKTISIYYETGRIQPVPARNLLRLFGGGADLEIKFNPDGQPTIGFASFGLPEHSRVKRRGKSRLPANIQTYLY